MLIYLLRHGIAEARATSDAERELTPEGVMQCKRVLDKFETQTPLLDKALMSPYKRAQQTASIFSTSFPDARFEISDHITPEANIYDVMDLIDKTAVRNLMLCKMKFH